MTTTTTNFGLTASQVKQFKERYHQTESKINEAYYERASLLAETRDIVGLDALQKLLRNVEGLGLTKGRVDGDLDLLVAYDRYKNNSLLWDACAGKDIVRISKLPNPLRSEVKGRVERRSQWVGGYISSSKLTAIINECDPEYYENNPGERAIKTAQNNERMEAVAKERMSLIRGLQSTIKALEENDIDGRSFIPRSALRIIDRHARTRSR